jgi:hypothetical protein
MIYLINCNNFCKYHHIPSITITKKRLKLEKPPEEKEKAIIASKIVKQIFYT